MIEISNNKDILKIFSHVRRFADCSGRAASLDRTSDGDRSGTLIKEYVTDTDDLQRV